MKKVAFKTLGCKVNSFESESMWQIFKENKYEKVDPSDLADVYVINTCTVTNMADRKSRQAIRQCVRRNPNAIVIVSGCYTQLASKDAGEIDGVDIILGTQYRNNIMQYINEFETNRKQITDVTNIIDQSEFEQLEIVSYDSQTRAFVKIQEGCNNFCSFCVIPWARGLMRSQKPEKILSQVEKLVNEGVNEIVLTGIHTGGYGNDFEKYKFIDLLKDLNEIEGLNRIRVSSIEISQITDEVLELFKTSSKFAKHLHIPIQSASDAILKKMKRKYTLQEYKDKIKEIREKLGDIAITTDIIVGFPGETIEDFTQSIEDLKEINFSDMHVFPYSKRNGTPAAKMPNQVDEQVKKKRVKILSELAKENNIKYNEKFLEKKLDVIVERKNKNGYFEGYTSNYIKVQFKSNVDCKNQITNVLIKEVNNERNIGEIY